MKLHPLVYVVADRPTKRNVSPEVPLVGTTSYKTLLNWLADMDVDITRVRLFNQCDKPFTNEFSRYSLLKSVELGHTRVIALGNKAMDYLVAIDLPEFFLLPHPSGLNRSNNNKRILQQKLEQCRSYIYEGVK